MKCERCPTAKLRRTCKSKRHHCERCNGIGMVRNSDGSALGTFIACPKCEGKDK